MRYVTKRSREEAIYGHLRNKPLCPRCLERIVAKAGEEICYRCRKKFNGRDYYGDPLPYYLKPDFVERDGKLISIETALD